MILIEQGKVLKVDRTAFQDVLRSSQNPLAQEILAWMDSHAEGGFLVGYVDGAFGFLRGIAQVPREHLEEAIKEMREKEENIEEVADELWMTWAVAGPDDLNPKAGGFFGADLPG